MSAPPPKPPFAPEEETTDLKLALLLSLHPAVPLSTLLDALTSTAGSVSAASALLSPPPAAPPPAAPATTQSTLPFAAPPPKPPRKGTTLHLHTPFHVAALTPTTLHPSFLPPSLASALLTSLLSESTTFPPPPTFHLFSRSVTSPHTSALFLRGATSTAQHYYQAAPLPTRPFTPSLEAATALVEDAVNTALSTRPPFPGQLPAGRWRVNAALVNAYRGPSEGVGWHSDQLTYLGPGAVIAGLSLGCAREMRLRRATTTSEEGVGEEAGQIALHLPHNSLLIMHAGMQEGWKHAVPPVRAATPHGVAGTTRINVTYRCYRDGFGPEWTPRCGCGEGGVLRCVFKPRRGDETGGAGGELRRVEELGSRGGDESGTGEEPKETKPRYFWTCAQEYRGGTPCGFFQWAIFDSSGEPSWSPSFRGGSDTKTAVKGEGVDEEEEWEELPSSFLAAADAADGVGDGEVVVDKEEEEEEEEEEEREWSDETVEGERSPREEWEEVGEEWAGVEDEDEGQGEGVMVVGKGKGKERGEC